jgi:hypothetical protein
MVRNAKEGAVQLGQGAAGLVKDTLFPQGKTEGEKLSYLGKKYIFDPADAEAKKAQNAATPWESLGHSVAESIPLIGPWAASLGEQAGTGDVGGAAAKGGTQVLAAELGPKAVGAAGKAIPKLGEWGLSKVFPTTYANINRMSNVGEALKASGAVDTLVDQGRKTLDAAQKAQQAASARTAAARSKAAPAPKAPTADTLFPGADSTAPTATIPNPGEIPPSAAPAKPSPAPKTPPSSGGASLDEIVNQATGAKPLQSNVPLRDQLIAKPPITLSEPLNSAKPRPVGGTTPEAQFENSFGPEHEHVRAQAEWETGKPEGNLPEAKRDPVQAANGSRLWEAVKNSPELAAKFVGKDGLKNVEIRNALIHAGEDMGDTVVSNKMLMGEGAITREAALNKLLDKGLSPAKIIELGKKPLPNPQPPKPAGK